MTNRELLTEPLISAEIADTASSREAVTEMDKSMVGKMKQSCLLLGILIGFFIQVSTVGASFLTNLPWAKGSSDQNVAVYALAWSVITASASCGVMMIFRSFVEITFNLTFGNRLANDHVTHDRLLDELVWHFECYFSLGVLISVTMAWVATSIFLGMPSTFIDICITIALPVFWCVSFFIIFMTKDKTDNSSSPKTKASKQIPALQLV